MAGALVDVLVGEREPGGRLPTTFPKRMKDTPAFLDWPGEAGVARYGEGLFSGYRWYHERDIEPAFPFGHGLSYTTFGWGPASMSTGVVSSDALAAGAAVVVSITLENTGARSGSEVVQVYVSPPRGPWRRPPQALVAFEKLTLAPGASGTSRVELGVRAFAMWQPERTDLGVGRAMPGVLGDGSAVHDGLVGWQVTPGDHRVLLARSADDVVAELVLTIE
jgi:beta-glucosidase